MSTTPSDFEVLGIAPTSSLAEVKRAYFEALRKHPPHSDPTGFRAIRDAYERLCRPGALASASWTAPFDRAAEAHALQLRLAPRLDKRRASRAVQESDQALIRRIDTALSTLSWGELLALLR